MGAGACIRICPNHAITLENGKASTNRDVCTGCGLCEPVCHNKGREITRGGHYGGRGF